MNEDYASFKPDITEFKELTNYEMLIAAVIRSGIDEKDTAYFLSDTFFYHCELLQLNYTTLKDSILEQLGQLKEPTTKRCPACLDTKSLKEDFYYIEERQQHYNYCKACVAWQYRSKRNDKQLQQKRFR